MRTACGVGTPRSLQRRRTAALTALWALLADAGYRGDATFQTLETRQITANLSLGREGKPGTTPNPAHAWAPGLPTRADVPAVDGGKRSSSL